MDVPTSYQYYPTVSLSDLSDLYSVGDNRLNNQKICIISYLPKILRIGIDLKTVKNRYILFIEDTASVDSITWSIQFYNKGEARGDAGLVTTGANTNDFLVSMNEDLFDNITNKLLFDKLIVSCEIIKGAETRNLSIEHILVSMYEFGNLLIENEIKPGLFEKFFISNPVSTNYLFNCLNDYLTEPVIKWNNTDILPGIPAEKENLQKIIASVMYYNIFHYSKISGEDTVDIFNFENENIKTHLNSDPEIPYDGGFRSGICYTPLYLLNEIFSDIKQVPDFNNISNTDKIYEILNDETLKNTSSRPDLDDNVTDLMHSKITESKARLYGDKDKLREFFNLTLFPKSCIKLTAILIKYLFECSQKNLCNECIGKDDEWLNIGLDTIDEYEKFFKNILTHYFLAPAGKITKIIKPARKTWKYFGSIYIDMIVNNLPRILTSYFAKKVVKLANDEQTCHFERLDSEQIRLGNNGLPLALQPNIDLYLGRQVYLIVETLNCRGKQITCNIRPSSNVLTGNTNNLDLVIGPASWNPAAPQDPVFNNGTDFIAEVGRHDLLKNINDSLAHYVNVHDDSTNGKYNVDHIDKAIIKLQLRPSVRAIYDVWANNLGNGITNLEILAQPTGIADKLYGNNPKISTNPGEFLNNRDEYDNVTRFRFKNKIVYEIFDVGNEYSFLIINGGIRMKIGVIENNSAGDHIMYFYHDQYDNEHEICDRNWLGCTTDIVKFQINEKGPRSNIIPNLAARGALLGTFDLNPFRNAGENIDATLLTFYANGTLAAGNNGNRWYPNTGNFVFMINGDIRQDPGMGPQNFTALEYEDIRNGYELRITYLFQDTRRRSVNPDVFAGIIGALAKLNLTPDPNPNPNNIDYNLIEIISEGFAYEDGSCYPSTMHRNGEAFDTHYNDPPFDVQQTFVNAMDEFEFDRNIVGSAASGHTGYANSVADNGQFGGIHNNHMHSDTYNHNRIQVINP